MGLQFTDEKMVINKRKRKYFHIIGSVFISRGNSFQTTKYFHERVRECVFFLNEKNEYWWGVRYKDIPMDFPRYFSEWTSGEKNSIYDEQLSKYKWKWEFKKVIDFTIDDIREGVIVKYWLGGIYVIELKLVIPPKRREFIICDINTYCYKRFNPKKEMEIINHHFFDVCTTFEWNLLQRKVEQLKN